MEVQNLGRREAARAVPALVRAFWDFPEAVHLLPDEGRRRRVLPRYLGSDVRDASRYGTLLAAVDGDDVLGAAAWLPPGSYPVGLGRQVREALHLAPIVPWGLGALREALRGQAGNRLHHVGRSGHFWLRAIGIDPSRQGEGLGTSLVRPVLDRADAEGRGSYLTTATAANAVWYGRLGFNTVATYHPTLSWPQVWAMWRPPLPG